MRVVYMGQDPHVVARLKQAFAPWGDVIQCQNHPLVAESASRLVTPDEGGIIILDLAAGHRAVDARTLAEARRKAPAVAWVLLADLERTSIRAVVELAPAGVDGVVLRGQDDTPLQLRHVGLHAFQLGIARYCADRLGSALPENLHCIINACARCAVIGPSVSAVAALARLSREATRAVLREAELRSLRTIFGSCRAFAASCFIGWSRLPIADIAETMAFSSANGLRDVLRRYTGLTVRTLRHHHCTDEELVQRLVERLRTPPAVRSDPLQPPCVRRAGATVAVAGADKGAGRV